MKRLFLFCVILLLSSFSNAAVFGKTGEIRMLSVTDSALAYDPSLTVQEFTSAGSCYKDSTGHVPIMMRQDEKGRAQLSLVLAAFMSGKNIQIKVDDNIKHSSGICYLYWVGLQSEEN